MDASIILNQFSEKIREAKIENREVTSFTVSEECYQQLLAIANIYTPRIISIDSNSKTAEVFNIPIKVKKDSSKLIIRTNTKIK